MNKIVMMFNWLYNACIYWWHFNQKRDNSLWVFGCWGGNKFSDNAKYLFQYVTEHYSGIHSVWITRDRQIEISLRERGYEVYMANTLAAKKFLKRAGVAFYTNSLNDFGARPYLCGAKLCALFHGVGFKNELRELDDPKKLKAKLKNVKHKIYDTSYTDFIFTTSEFTREKFYKQQYNARKERIILSGQPRNDIFFESTSKKNIEHDKTILYMPTFREDAVGQRKLEDIINQIANSYELDCILQQYGYQLMIKPHYLMHIKKGHARSRIAVLNDKDIPDIQALLNDVSVLITDYSSVIGDYVLLQRPIIFFSYDLEEYKRFKPMNQAYNDILRETYVTSINELSLLLDKLFQGNVNYRSVNNKINNYLNAPNLRSGGYCKNICDYMVDYLKL